MFTDIEDVDVSPGDRPVFRQIETTDQFQNGRFPFAGSGYQRISPARTHRKADSVQNLRSAGIGKTDAFQFNSRVEIAGAFHCPVREFISGLEQSIDRRNIRLLVLDSVIHLLQLVQMVEHQRDQQNGGDQVPDHSPLKIIVHQNGDHDGELEQQDQQGHGIAAGNVQQHGFVHPQRQQMPDRKHLFDPSRNRVHQMQFDRGVEVVQDLFIDLLAAFPDFGVGFGDQFPEEPGLERLHRHPRDQCRDQPQRQVDVPQ